MSDRNVDARAQSGNGANIRVYRRTEGDAALLIAEVFELIAAQPRRR